ncbi:MAG: hypothetical protein M3T96_06905 [Acidobacteriota bacterium]|nr:hypothetical protein [Acidobacteriota bacterium]
MMSKKMRREDFIGGDRLRFRKYEVEIEVRAANALWLAAVYASLERVFPNGLDLPAAERAAKAAHQFTIEAKENGALVFLAGGEYQFEVIEHAVFFEMVESRLRLTIAEFAVGKVFLHAGVVGWRGRAIILPGRSFAGKTTLVAELVKKGAAYYSDEYAVLNGDGAVEPFPKWLSMRGIIDEWTQVDCPVEAFGGTNAVETIPAALVLFAEYRKNQKSPRRWQPQKLSPGAAVMEILPHSLSIRNNPRFVLDVLNKLVHRAIIIKTVRGEAVNFAETLLGYFESQTV